MAKSKRIADAIRTRTEIARILVVNEAGPIGRRIVDRVMIAVTDPGMVR